MIIRYRQAAMRKTHLWGEAGRLCCGEKWVERSWLHAVCSCARARVQDKAKRELVDLKNQADSLAYQSEKQLKDAPADKLPADVKSKVWLGRC